MWNVREYIYILHKRSYSLNPSQKWHYSCNIKHWLKPKIPQADIINNNQPADFWVVFGEAFVVCLWLEQTPSIPLMPKIEMHKLVKALQSQ